jgi:hypothetical protein
MTIILRKPVGPVTGWAVVADGRVVRDTAGRDIGRFLIYRTRADAVESKLDGERVVRVEVREVLPLGGK